MTDFLEMNPLQSAIAIIISFSGSFPGAIFAAFLARTLDPIKAAIVSNVLMIVCVTVFALILTAPGQYIRAYIYFLFIGFNSGIKVNLDRLLSASLMPTGQEAEMMGLWLFADQSLLWLPLLVYTIMNEADISPRISVVVLDVYLCLSLFYLYMTGSYSDARVEVNRTSVFSAKGLQGLSTITLEASKNDAAAVEGSKDDVVKDDVVKDEKDSQPTAQAEETYAEA